MAGSVGSTVPPGGSRHYPAGRGHMGSVGHAEIVRELKMAKSRHPVEPLFKGTWQ